MFWAPEPIIGSHPPELRSAKAKAAIVSLSRCSREWNQEAPRRPRDAPRTPRDAPKRLQDAPRTPPGPPKSLIFQPRDPQTTLHKIPLGSTLDPGPGLAGLAKRLELFVSLCLVIFSGFTARGPQTMQTNHMFHVFSTWNHQISLNSCRKHEMSCLFSKKCVIF